ncbi:MAG: DegT/DnrJ/EryC1/StrS family aminotransferase [Sedimentisphaeraceae bacterium JB056]
MKVNLSRPDITELEVNAVVEVLRSNQLSLGPKLTEFEEAMARYSGCKHGIAVNSGTSGLFLCMESLGIGPGDEVITTPFTFIATVNSILQVGAKPVFVDIDPVSMNIDPSKIEEKITPKTKAIEPVYVFGNPWGIDTVCDIAKKHNLAVIEDSCEALGTVYKGKKSGTFGDVGLYAFYPNKQITTGEGGIIITDSDKIAEMCISLRNQGRGAGGGWLAHERMGYNFRMCDINCALGITQLSRLEEFKKLRKKAADTYCEILADEDRIILPTEPEDCDMSWFVFVVRLTEDYTLEQRNSLLQDMISKGIQVSNYFPPVHLQPFMVEKFGYKRGMFPTTEYTCDHTAALPFYNRITTEDIELVCKELKDSLDKL